MVSYEHLILVCSLPHFVAFIPASYNAKICNTTPTDLSFILSSVGTFKYVLQYLSARVIACVTLPALNFVLVKICTQTTEIICHALKFHLLANV